MRVIFAIPALDGKVHTQCLLSLVATEQILTLKGISHDVFCISNCPYLPMARNTLAAMFLADQEATDLFFIDSDIGFDAEAVVKILERLEPIVAGIYPLKRDALGFPVKIRTEDGVPLGRDGLIEAELLPTGFMRIKRHVFELMAEKYPELRYADNVVEVMRQDRPLKEVYDFFGMGVFNNRFTTEDYAFCQKWRNLGGTAWVYPNINFEHIGTKSYASNYHEYLLKLPGGAKQKWNLSKAWQIGGWMSLEELAWLAEQASKREHIVELGSYVGRSTRAMADNTKGVIIAIDDWYGPREAKLSEEIRENLWPMFQENLKDHITNKKVMPIRADHEESAIMLIEPGWPDMVFIDGDHAYESVKRDIQNWLPEIKPGGLLCGHDYNWPSVRQAVDELLPGVTYIPETNIWSWQVPVKGGSDVFGVSSDHVRA